EGDGGIDSDLIGAGEIEAAEILRGQMGRVEIEGIGAIGRQRAAGVHACGDGGDVSDLDVAVVAAGKAEIAVTADDELSGKRGGVLRQRVAIGDAGGPRIGLALAGDDVGKDGALEYRGRGRED